MKRKTVFVLFVVPEVGSVAIKRQETLTREGFYRVPKLKVIRTASVRARAYSPEGGIEYSWNVILAVPEPRVGNLTGENRQ
jgi:hypothetical protein